MKKIIEPWKEDFCFIPLDKNSNTWSMIYKHEYMQMVVKEFISKYYTEISISNRYYGIYKKEFQKNLFWKL